MLNVQLVITQSLTQLMEINVSHVLPLVLFVLLQAIVLNAAILFSSTP